MDAAQLLRGGRAVILADEQAVAQIRRLAGGDHAGAEGQVALVLYHHAVLIVHLDGAVQGNDVLAVIANLHKQVQVDKGIGIILDEVPAVYHRQAAEALVGDEAGVLLVRYGFLRGRLGNAALVLEQILQLIKGAGSHGASAGKDQAERRQQSNPLFHYHISSLKLSFP